MRSRNLLIGLALLLLLLALSRTFTDDRDASVRPLAPAGDVSARPLAGPSTQIEPAETPARVPEPGDPDEAEELAVTGCVTRDTDGEPIVGARVLVFDRRPLFEGAPWVAEFSGEIRDLRTDLVPFAETRTGDLGTFQVEVPAPGTWAVVASYPPLRSASWVIKPGQEQWFSLRESTRMSFRVVDETDRPVAGAQVFVFDAVSSPALFHTVTNADGTFDVDACPRYDDLLIRAEGYADRRIEDLDEWVDEPIVLSSPYRVAGVVHDHEGKPVEGASIVLMGYWGELRLTGADGRFSFDRVASRDSGSWLDVRHPDLGAIEVQVSPGDDDVAVRFGAPSRFSLAGKTEIPSAAVVSQLFLHAWATWSEPNLTKENSSTEFRITGTGEGTLLLSATAVRSISTVRGDLTVRTAEGRLTLEVARGSSAKGVVLRLDPVTESYVPLKAVDEEGKPIRNLDFIFTLDEPDRDRVVSTRGDGIALARLPVPAGTPVELRTGGRLGPLPVFDIGHTVSAVTTLEPDVPPTVVVVRRSPEFVFEARDEKGRPLPPGTQARFLVQQAHWSNYADPRPEDPRWGRAPLLPREPFRLIARATGRASVSRSFGPPGGRPRTITVSLPPEGLLRGRLLTATGRPVARADLRAEVFHESESVGYRWGQEIQPDGRFEIGGLCSGRVRLSIRHDGDFAAEVFADVVAGRVTDLGDVQIGGVTVLRGTVFGADLRGLGGVEVTVHRPGTNAAGIRWTPLARTHTRRNGSYQLPIPWRSGHEVIFSKPGFEELRLPFDRRQFENPLDVTLVRSR